MSKQGQRLNFLADVRNVLETFSNKWVTLEDKARGLHKFLTPESIQYLQRVHKNKRHSSRNVWKSKDSGTYKIEGMIQMLVDYAKTIHVDSPTTKTSVYTTPDSDKISSSLYSTYFVEVKNLHNLILQAEKNLEKEKNIFDEKQEEVKELEKKLDDLKELIGSGWHKISEEGGNLDYLEKNLEEQNEQLRTSALNVKEENLQLQGELSKLQTRHTSVKYRRAELEEKLDSVNKSIETSMKALVLHEKELNNETESFEREMDGLYKTHKEMQTSLTEANSEIESKLSYQKVLETQLFRIKTELKALAVQYSKKADHMASQGNNTSDQGPINGFEKKYPGAPTGVVTIVFSAVEGKKQLWEDALDAMILAQEMHNKILRLQIKEYGGYEVKTDADKFMVAFSQPENALNYCMAVQEALLGADWPHKLLRNPFAEEVLSEDGRTIFRGLRVGMGFHAGKPQCRPNLLANKMDYFGSMVNKAARIAALACGGRVLSGESTIKGLQEGGQINLRKVNLRDLGSFRLKGIAGEENIAEIVPKSLADRVFPDIDSAGSSHDVVSLGNQEILKVEEVKPASVESSPQVDSAQSRQQQDDLNKDYGDSQSTAPPESQDEDNEDINIRDEKDSRSGSNENEHKDENFIESMFDEISETLAHEDGKDLIVEEEMVCNMLESQREKLEEQHKDMKQQLELCSEEKVHLERHLKELRSTLKMLNAGIVSETQKCKKAQVEIAKGAHDKVQKKSVLHKTRKANVDLEGRSSNLEEEAKQIDLQKNDCESKLKILEEKVSKVQTNKEALRSIRDEQYDLEDKIASSNVRKDELLAIISKLEKDLIEANDTKMKTGAFGRMGMYMSSTDLAAIGRGESSAEYRPKVDAYSGEDGVNMDEIMYNARLDPDAPSLNNAASDLTSSQAKLDRVCEEKEVFEKQLRMLELEMSSIDSQINNLNGILSESDLVDDGEAHKLELAKAEVEKEVWSKKLKDTKLSCERDIQRQEKHLEALKELKRKELARHKVLKGEFRQLMMQVVAKGQLSDNSIEEKNEKHSTSKGHVKSNNVPDDPRELSDNEEIVVVDSLGRLIEGAQIIANNGIVVGPDGNILNDAFCMTKSDYVFMSESSSGIHSDITAGSLPGTIIQGSLIAVDIYGNPIPGAIISGPQSAPIAVDITGVPIPGAIIQSAPAAAPVVVDITGKTIPGATVQDAPATARIAVDINGKPIPGAIIQSAPAAGPVVVDITGKTIPGATVQDAPAAAPIAVDINGKPIPGAIIQSAPAPVPIVVDITGKIIPGATVQDAPAAAPIAVDINGKPIPGAIIQSAPAPVPIVVDITGKIIPGATVQDAPATARIAVDINGKPIPGAIIQSAPAAGPVVVDITGNTIPGATVQDAPATASIAVDINGKPIPGATVQDAPAAAPIAVDINGKPIPGATVQDARAAAPIAVDINGKPIPGAIIQSAPAAAPVVVDITGKTIPGATVQDAPAAARIAVDINGKPIPGAIIQSAPAAAPVVVDITGKTIPGATVQDAPAAARIAVDINGKPIPGAIIQSAPAAAPVVVDITGKTIPGAIVQAAPVASPIAVDVNGKPIPGAIVHHPQHCDYSFGINAPYGFVRQDKFSFPNVGNTYGRQQVLPTLSRGTGPSRVPGIPSGLRPEDTITVATFDNAGKVTFTKVPYGSLPPGTQIKYGAVPRSVSEAELDSLAVGNSLPSSKWIRPGSPKKNISRYFYNHEQARSPGSISLLVPSKDENVPAPLLANNLKTPGNQGSGKTMHFHKRGLDLARDLFDISSSSNLKSRVKEMKNEVNFEELLRAQSIITQTVPNPNASKNFGFLELMGRMLLTDGNYRQPVSSGELASVGVSKDILRSTDEEVRSIILTPFRNGDGNMEELKYSPRGEFRGKKTNQRIPVGRHPHHLQQTRTDNFIDHSHLMVAGTRFGAEQSDQSSSPYGGSKRRLF